MSNDDINKNNRRNPIKRHTDPYNIRQSDEDDISDDNEQIIEGRNAVIEAFRAGITIDKVYIVKGDTDKTLRHIASVARENGTPVSETDKRKLDYMSRTKAHQGVVAQVAPIKYSTINEILEIADKRNETPLIVVCDGIEDPHNLGAIIRSSEAAGVHGIIIPKRRSSGLTATVVKASAGAVFHMAIAKVSNITQTIKELQNSGIWIFGTSDDGQIEMWQSDMTGPAAIIIGSEGSGISRLVRESCDFIIKIPMHGKISSLNASVSTAIMIYEAVRQRKLKA